MRKAVFNGVCNYVLLISLSASGCLSPDVKPVHVERLDRSAAVTGGVIDGNVSINDWKMVVGLCVCGLVSVGGFMVIGRKLAQHHAAVNRPATPSRN
jgi:hypothetical protein